MTQDDLKILRDIMREEIQSALAPISGKLGEIQEEAKVTREAANTLLRWAEDAQIEVKIPLYPKPDQQAE